MKAADEKIHEQALKRYKLASEAEAKQREREQEDLRFQVPEMQWDDDSRRARQGGMVAGVPVPARPILSIPKLDQPIQLVLNQERSAHLGINIHPLSEDADDDTAAVLQGLYRFIERDSRAELARSWAFERAVKAGRGAYRINTDWDDTGHPFDQKIVISRILYQEAVYFDPSAQEPDFCDGEWAFVTSWVPLPTFKRLYPDAEISSATDMDFSDAYSQTPEWVKGDGDERAILVAEYFYKDHEKETIVVLQDGNVVVKDETIPPELIVGERERDKVSVRWCKLTGTEILEQQDWNGKYIPIVPVVGKELQPFDDERYWTGMIRGARDAQRLFNFAASSAVEMAALEPRAPWLMTEGQMEGYESMWQQSNTRNFPVLMYKQTTVGGTPAPPPQRVQVDVARLGPSMALLNQADDFIQSATATYDPSLGNLTKSDRSGKAIKALQSQTDAGNSNFLQQLADVAMTLEAKIILDLIPTIYDRPGRVARTLDFEDKAHQVILNAPFVSDPRNGRAVPAEGAPPGMKVKNFDLKKGRYGVAISVGKSWQTRLQQGAEEIGQILESAPQLMPILGPIYFKFRDFPGAKEIAEVLKKVRDQQFPGLDDDENDMSPQKMQELLKQAAQENQMLKQQIQQAAELIKTEQIKQQAQVQKAQVEGQSRTEVAKVTAESKVMVEQLQAQTQILLQKMEERFEAIQKALDRAQEREIERMQMQAEMRKAAMAAVKDDSDSDD